MRRLSRGAAWLLLGACAACPACGGDYWLGGKRGLGDGAGGAGGRAVGEAGAGKDGGSSRDGGPSREGGPGDHVLSTDVVLRNDDSYELGPDDTGRCRLVGNGHSIRSEDTWTGHVTIRGCTIEGLGSAGEHAISLVVWGDGAVTVEGSTFRGSGAIRVTNQDASTTVFRNNTIADDSVVSLDPSGDVTIPAFLAQGASEAPKLFQGNRILRGPALFQSANWLIGGSTDADGNVLVGLRAGVVLAAPGLVMRGNYVHVLHLGGAGDEAALSVSYETRDTLVEHNVLRGGNWVIRSFGGELRYNAVLDAEFSAWLNQPLDDAKIHHDLFFMCHEPRSEPEAGINLVNARTSGIEIYNNTFDGGGPNMAFSGPAIAIAGGCFLASLRNDLFFDFPFRRNDGGGAAVRPGVLEGIEPRPVRLGYADYNLFHDPDAVPPRNYAVVVEGRTERTDPGFGAHDAHAFGPLDEQVDPGPLGATECFPWSDEDIVSGTVPVSRMLEAFRSAYTPAPGSAALGAGDPADGPGTPVGAIGDGASTDDRFGTFGR